MQFGVGWWSPTIRSERLGTREHPASSSGDGRASGECCGNPPSRKYLCRFVFSWANGPHCGSNSLATFPIAICPPPRKNLTSHTLFPHACIVVALGRMPIPRNPSCSRKMIVAKFTHAESISAESVLVDDLWKGQAAWKVRRTGFVTGGSAGSGGSSCRRKTSNPSHPPCEKLPSLPGARVGPFVAVSFCRMRSSVFPL